MMQGPMLRAGWFGRALAGLALAATLLPWAPVPTPARAEHEAGHEPVARLQLLLKEIYIYDDHDPGWFLGAGELHLFVGWPGSGYRTSFSASGGNTVTLDRLAVDNVFNEPGEGSESWFPVYAGERFGVTSNIEERDDFTDTDYLGTTLTFFADRDGWGVGTHKERSYFNNDQGMFDHLGDYELTFEIRRAPVPDLEPVSMKVTRGAPSALDTVCAAVLNREVGDAGPFWVSLHVDGVLRARQHFGGLASGQHVDFCAADTLPTITKLMVTVDEERTVIEYNETNNRLEQTYFAPPAEDGPAAAPTPSPTQADLWVRGLLVRSAEQGGSDSCQAGRNDITVIVRNEGAATTTSFVVRLIVDREDNEAKEKSVAGLDAGKELEVTFDDVRLRRGMRDLEAIVDAKKAVAESNEDNNQIKLTVNCRDN